VKVIELGRDLEARAADDDERDTWRRPLLVTCTTLDHFVVVPLTVAEASRLMSELQMAIIVARTR